MTASPSNSSPPVSAALDEQPIIRAYQDEDHAAVQELYQTGLLTGQNDYNDTAVDLDHMHEAYFSHPKDHFWVAQAQNQVIGCIGVAHDDAVAQVRRLRVAAPYQNSPLPVRLLDTALGHCRKHGVLKVVLDTHLDTARAIELINGSGFQFARGKQVQVQGKEVLEFYFNLYERPDELRRQVSHVPAGADRPTGASDAAASVAPDPGERSGGKVRVLLADDHQIFRTSLAGLLHGEPDIEIIGEASDGEQAIEMSRRIKPDLVVMDVNMPKRTGIEATRAITRELPTTRVIGLSMYERNEIAAMMLEAGAVAYLPKDAPPNLLVEAIRR